MNLYRIYTENKNLFSLKSIIKKHLRNFTLYEGIGCYLGGEEPCLIIEVVAISEYRKKIEAVAKSIKKINRQHSVLITEQRVSITRK